MYRISILEKKKQNDHVPRAGKSLAICIVARLTKSFRVLEILKVETKVITLFSGLDKMMQMYRK